MQLLSLVIEHNSVFNEHFCGGVHCLRMIIETYGLRYTECSNTTLNYQISECNNLEKLARQAGPPLVFDASQKGNWENIRNEAINGKPFRFKREILEAPLNVRHRLCYAAPVALLSSS